MSRRSRVLLQTLAVLPGLAAAQPGMPQLVPGDLPGLEVVRVQSYAGKGLYGHIDGGADLYHEYGFERLSVQELRLNGATYFTEAYRMTDPGAAFGIFSISRGECAPADSLPRPSCVSPRAIQWAQSRYFVRVAGESNSAGAQAGMLRLARALSAKIPGDLWNIPPLPAAAGGKERTLLLVRGILGMQNGFDRWSTLVEGLDNFEAAIFLREDSTGQTAAAEFRFAADTDLERFSRAFSGRGKYVLSMQKGERRLLVMESDTPADSLWARLVKIP
jgi:hypothetical protein